MNEEQITHYRTLMIPNNPSNLQAPQDGHNFSSRLYHALFSRLIGN
jgi:hypothetical protein